MKYPNNRTLLYTIVRTQIGGYGEELAPVVLDSFRTLQRAEEVVGQHEQTFIDNDLEGMYKFTIQTSSFYNE
jgi:hypothetical protein